VDARWYGFSGQKVLFWVYFGSPFEWKILAYFVTIWNILRPFRIFYGHLLMLRSWGIYLSSFGTLQQVKSGNPDFRVKKIGRKHSAVQGCQMVCFQTKNPNLGKFWWVLRWNLLVYFMDTWSILRSFVIFYGHLV
jgi:hypothetical protein